MSKWLGKTWKGVLLAVVASVFALGSVASAGQCTNDRWNKVMKRGKIVIGVKADYKPWGYRNTSGGLVGMEIDMAKDVAAAMGKTGYIPEPANVTSGWVDFASMRRQLL